MNWYKKTLISSFFKQADVVGLIPALQNWGVAKGKEPEDINFAIQQLQNLEQEHLAEGKKANDNWLRGQFANLLFQSVKQQPVKKEDPLARKAKGISAQYWQWVLQVMQTENIQDFDRSIFDYFKNQNVDPLAPPLTYQQANQGSQQYHRQFYEQKEKATYKTPITAGEPVGDMFMVEVTEEDQVAEGANMQNCIGEVCVVGDGTRMFSLRDKNNNPHVSIKVEEDAMQQIRGKQNRPVISKYAKYVVEWIVAHPELDVESFDNMSIDEQDLIKLQESVGLYGFLRESARIGSIKLVNIAIQRGATNNLNDAMSHAAKNGHKEIVELLMQHGANDFNYSLGRAASGGHIEIVELLMQHGANDFNYSLGRAASGGHIEIVELMIQRGANYFDGAMVWSAEGGHKEIVELMIQYGATDFNDAMEYAAKSGHKEIVELMIQHGANNFDWAMHAAAESGNKEIVKLLQQAKQKQYELV